MSGSCDVKKANEGKEDSILARLGEGDYFGETALINEAPRGASIQCVDKMEVAFWTTAKFKKLKKERLKGIRFVQRKAISAEMISNIADEVDESKREKTEGQRKLILGVVKQNDLFRNLSSEHMRKVIEKMHSMEIKAETKVITQGEAGLMVYVVESGEFDIYVENKKKGSPGKLVGTLGKGKLFGELALLFNAPRAATVIAKTNALCWVIDRFTFRNVLKDVSEAETKTNTEFLKRVEILKALTQMERKKIAEAMEEKQFNTGDDVVKQGDAGDCMYIVKSGNLQITIDGQMQSKTYGPGEFFGEKALMDDKAKGVRAATITCSSDSILLALDRNAVFGLLGPIHEELKESSSQYTLPAQESKEIKLPKSTYTPVKWKLADFTSGRVLGKGSFGVVKIVTAPDGETYALKGVSKKQVVLDGQQPHIVSEKKVMQRLNHPLLVKLFGAYNDDRCVYFLLELCQGGELFTILRSKTRFNLKTSTFYAASVVSMFEYLHGMNIVYRDLKPENLLIDTKGYLKMTDFGFAKEIHGKTYTLCGTPDYLAPEVLTGNGHGKGADWWCLGILIYEMLASFPPFYDDDTQRTYAKILYKRVAFPSNTFSAEGKDLVRRLLEKKQHLRLGVVRGGATNIKKHAFFSGFDFAALESKKLQPPIIPAIKDKNDVSAFEDYGSGLVIDEEGEELLDPYIT
ncbi:hypothetical protein AAMO2058_001578600 [Amorphochlora amoebiformis]